MTSPPVSAHALAAKLADLELRRDAFVRLLERSKISRVCAGYLRHIEDLREEIDALQLEVGDCAPVGGAMVEVAMTDDDPDADGIEIEIVSYEDAFDAAPTDPRGRVTAPYPVPAQRFRVSALVESFRAIK